MCDQIAGIEFKNFLKQLLSLFVVSALFTQNSQRREGIFVSGQFRLYCLQLLISLLLQPEVSFEQPFIVGERHIASRCTREKTGTSVSPALRFSVGSEASGDFRMR